MSAQAERRDLAPPQRPLERSPHGCAVDQAAALGRLLALRGWGPGRGERPGPPASRGPAADVWVLCQGFHNYRSRR